MDIQDEFPLAQDPLADLATDYHHAVLHIAWDWHRPPFDTVRLLFAFVELLPAEVPPPIDDYSFKDPGCRQRLGKASEHQVHIRRAVISAADALAWYMACRSGTAVLPDDNGSLRSPDDPGPQRLALLAPLGEEPAWPALLSAPDDSDMLPFAPAWIHCARSHHLVPTTEVDLEGLWPTAAEREEATNWLASVLHFELDQYPEYWGSVHLLAPNPVYRKMRSRLHRGEAPGESVLVKFQPRAGRSLDGLTLLYRERDAYGVTSGCVVRVRSDVLRFNSQSMVHSTSEDVFDERRGFLEVSHSMTTFVRGINMQFGAAQATRVQGAKSSYVVPKSGKPEVVTVGTHEPPAPARLRLITAHYARHSKKAAADQHQRWFLGQHAEARAFLRSILTVATETLLFVDPYFGPDELGEFLLAVSRTDVPVLVLSSGKGLKEKVVKGATIEKGDRLVEALAHLRTIQPMNPVEIRVMLGDDPPIHDRFMVVDRRIWHLGASLHDFGARGTLVLALPDPDEVRPHLLAAWDGAMPLDQWIQQRRRDRKPGPEAPP
jgi:hypothetical protein